MFRTQFDFNSKIWSGPNIPSLYNSKTSLGSIVLNVLKQTPEMITQISADTKNEMTCYEMRLRTIKIAKHLELIGFKKGDIAGFISSNSENLAPAVFACLTMGLPVNSLSPVFLESDIIHLYSITRPKVIFADFDVVAKVQRAVNSIPLDCAIYTFQEKVNGLIFINDILNTSCDPNEFICPDLGDVSNLSALILYSSGTTGRPKGVCKSHTQLIENHVPLWSLKSGESEVMFNFSTIYWGSGILFLLIGTLYKSRRIITTNTFDPELMVAIIERYKVTTILMPPSALAQLLISKSIKEFDSIEIFIVVGSVVTKSICEKAKKYLPNGDICTIYGTSEADYITFSFPGSKYGSVGFVARGIQVMIQDDDGKRLEPNQEGEIISKSRDTFLGYFNDPEMTKLTVENGWVRSGDIGYFDDAGFLYIVDRKKDMLKFDNYQVSPSEIEEIINSIDGIVGSCVIGVFEKDKGNDLIFAFVEKRPGVQDIEADFIADYVSHQVIDQKRLRGGVHFVDSLPLTVSGKVVRSEIKKLAEQLMSK